MLATGHLAHLAQTTFANRLFGKHNRGDKLLGIASVNRAGDHMFGRRFLPMERGLPPENAADPAFDLKAALA